REPADVRARPLARDLGKLSAAQGERTVQSADGRALRHREPHRRRAHAIQRSGAAVQHVAASVSGEPDGEAVRFQGISLVPGAGRREAGAEGRFQQVVNAPLPWERLLWRGRPIRLRPWLTDERYYLTDFRLVRDSRCCPDE